MKCPRCNIQVDIEEWDDSFKCPTCDLGGYWDEIYDEDDFWGRWFWDSFDKIEDKK